MTYIESYLSGIPNAGLRESIINTSNAVSANVLAHFNFNEPTTGLLLGNVQSGKTGQMLGIMSKLADEGYKLFLLLTTDNVDLQRQTYNRVLNSLPAFTVLTERDEEKFRALTQIQPLVIVLKKNTSVLRKWRDLLVASRTFKGLPLVIFDDEGDAASLNTLVNRHRVSTINRRLDEIRKTATSSLYFEVTATPQAIILQSIVSDWKPAFTNYFKPGIGYLGGNFFYSDPKSYCIRYTAEDELSEIQSDDDIPCPKGLQDSIYTFLVLCAHKKLNGESNCNFMIHPSSRIHIHERFKEVIDANLNLLQRSTDDPGFDESLKSIWVDLQRTRPDLEPYEDIKEEVVKILDNEELMVIPLNSKSFVCRDSNDPNALNLEKGFNIVVGGNTLGRGITFPHLQVVYYCRSSKKPQADTFWQHSRIFGYDREQELVRIYIPESLHKLFVELNKANEIIIKQVEKGLNDYQIVYPNNIQPTRKNVLDTQYLNVTMGGVNYFPTEPIPANVLTIDKLLDDANLSGDPAVVTKELMVELLKHCGSKDVNDFDSAKFISSIEALSAKRPGTKFKLIVRRDRDISKGTGTLLSPNDRALGDRLPNDVVLTLYRVKGTVDKGWDGNPLWIPNIKLPEGFCFYDTSSLVKETVETTKEEKPITSKKILNLSIEQNYFDEIVAGTKTHEYRDVTPGTERKYVYFELDGKFVAESSMLPQSKRLSKDVILHPIKYDQIKLSTGAYSGKRPYIIVEVLDTKISFDEDSDGTRMTLEDDYGTEYFMAQMDYTLGRILEKSEQ